jgi:hypothetical protein
MLPWIVQEVSIGPKDALVGAAPPFMNQITTVPLVLRQRMSLLPSPLKSPVPTIDQEASIGPKDSAHVRKASYRVGRAG